MSDKVQIELWENPKGAKLIQGFPGFGMVGTIVSEAVIDHLKPKLIGRIITPKLPALVAVHNKKIVEPLGIFYDSKNNLVIHHAITNISGMEWELTNSVMQIADSLKAKEIVCVEGIGTVGQKTETKGEHKTYYYTNHEAAKKKFDLMNVKPLKEGIVVGVTGSLLLRARDKQKISCIFGEAHTGIPDSRSAASIMTVLDKYLGLNVPSEPLLKKAEEFENKLGELFNNIKSTSDEKVKKERIPYIT